MFSRVWRYRGGRDGHETLQQFMHFLGRAPQTEPLTWAAAEGNMDGGGGVANGGVASNQTEGHRPNPYAGVIVFCVPMVTRTGRDAIDANSFHVMDL